MAEIIQDHDHNDSHLENYASSLSLQTQLPSKPSEELHQNDEDELSTTPVSPIMSRRTSVESDRYSTVSNLTNHFPSNPTNVNPHPAYVAPFGASQVVSEHQASKKRRASDDEEDDKQNKDDVQFSESALALVNAFLDQLLYSFLSTARSTSLLALRPAVTDVLKHRLAKEAISNAEEELQELLAGGDDEEEMDTKHKAAESSRKWDLELVWKRTRLRVMVYMRLGEMEDEDEQRYVKEDELFHDTERRYSSSTGLVSWAAAIFLTSVLEYVAEQTLQVAGQAAYTRERRQSRTQRVTGSADARKSDVLVVEEYDVEKVALNSTLGRLWRTWRKALRNNGVPSTPTYTHRSSMSVGRLSRDHMVSAMSHRNYSFSTAQEGSVAGDSRPISRDQHDPPDMEYPEHILAANIPLPIGHRERDIDEIIVPGLAKDPDEDDDTNDTIDTPYTALELGLLMPLPLVSEKRDVDEIEVPGLARDPDTDDLDTDKAADTQALTRRRSFSGFPTPDSSSSHSMSEKDMSLSVRNRSNSLPTLAPLPKEVNQDDDQGLQATRPEETAEEVNDQEAQRTDVSQIGNGAVAANSSAKVTPKHTPKAEFPWMAAGAVAGTSAAAAAWGANRHSVDFKGADGLVTSPVKEAEKNESPENVSKSLEAEEDVPQRKLSDKEIEELDKRKSLLDIKSMMVVNSPSGPASGQESGRESPQIVRSGSGDSYTLNRRNKKDDVSEEEGPDDAIGVAQTSSAANTTPSVTQEARESTKRPPRLIIGESQTNSVEKKPNGSQTPRQYLDLTQNADRQTTGSTVETSQTANKSTPRSGLAGLTNGVQQTPPTEKPSSPQQWAAAGLIQQSPSAEKSSTKQAWAAAGEKARSRRGSGKSTTSSHKKQTSSESPVQEHPAVQRMASIKRNEPKSAASDKAMPLTSASIRGPEDFDHFIQGAETLKYTLTPENVRDDSADNAAQYTPKSKQSPVELDATAKNDSRVGRSQNSKQATAATSGDDLGSSKRRSISKPSPRNISEHRRSGLMAREPRVMTESTRDFADFIRSTGPKEQAPVYPLLKNASQTSLHSLRSAHINGASATASRSGSPTGGDRTTSMTTATGEDENVPPVPPIPSGRNTPNRSKANMQPRGATSVSGGSSDLIDFIRSGPEEDGKHRISRTVAPFRNTQDSDQMKGWDDRLNPDSGAPSVRAPSMQSSAQRTSINSRSALLSNGTGHTTLPGKTSQGTPAGPRSGTTTPRDVESGKKQYRNKDPYSMDFLDEDDDDDLITAVPARGGRKEESWVEFLNSHEPSNNTPPRPLVDPNSAQAQNAIRNARSHSVRAATGGSAKSVPNNAGPRPGPANSINSLSNLSGPNQAQISTSATSTPSVKKKMEARNPSSKASARTTNTNDLAAFLKSSGPEDPDSAPAPIVGVRGTKQKQKEDEKAKKKAEKKRSLGFFSRTKKNTYIDMP